MNQLPFNHHLVPHHQKPYPPLPKHLLKIYQSNRKLAPWIHKAIDRTPQYE